MSKQNRYQIINGTFYKKSIPGNLIRVLEEARTKGLKICIVYGDTKTGCVWNKGEPFCGYVGRRNVNEAVPILLNTKRSEGGECIMDASILEIRDIKGKVLYRWFKVISVEER